MGEMVSLYSKTARNGTTATVAVKGDRKMRLTEDKVYTLDLKTPCPLCARLATIQAREDAWHVICPHCLRFTLDPYLLDLFESARQRTDVRILRLLPRLSDAARHTAAQGGRLNLIAENWRAVASDAAAHGM